MRILVVDDSLAVRKFFSFALRALRELTVDEASSAATAIDALLAEPCALVLTSANVRGIDRRPLHAVMRDHEQLSSIPVIAYTYGTYAKETQGVGPLLVLKMPVEATDACALIADALGLTHPETNLGSEKRSRSRVQLAMTMCVDGKHFTSWDLSPDGMYLATEAPLAVGTDVRVSGAFPHLDKPVEAMGVVVRAHKRATDTYPAGFAVSFEANAQCTPFLPAFIAPVGRPPGVPARL